MGLLDIWKIDDPVDRAWVGSKISPFPLRYFEQPVRLPAGAAGRLARTYGASTGYPAAHTVFAPFAERARREGWRYHELDTGHDAMVSRPGAVADLLGADQCVTRA